MKPGMKNKIITGLLLAAYAMTIIIYGRWVLFVAISVSTGVILWEYFQHLEKKGFKPMKVFGIIAGWSFLAIAFANMMNNNKENLPAVFGIAVILNVLMILIIQFVQIAQNKQKYSIVDLSTTVFGSIYIGGFMSFIFLLLGFGINKFPDNMALSRLPLFMAMWAAWGTDSSAYFFGSFFGKTKLLPSISPNKTVEGAIGGTLSCAAGMCAIAYMIDVPIIHAIPLGLCASIAGQIGDLSESAFKREMGIKDSGAIFGSHGGILDRVDSFLFTLPVIYYYFVWVRPWG